MNRRGWVAIALAAAFGGRGGADGTTLLPVATGGLTPLPVEVPARRCEGCHAEEGAAWAESAHRRAWTNPWMQWGFVDEPQAFCVHCHAPTEAQKAEITANLGWYRSLGGGPPASPRPEPTAELGVHCVACHVRDGQILGREATLTAPHRVTAAPLDDPRLCAGCHEFAMPETIDGALHPTDVPMQSTYTEWLAWGGEATCVDCHMPDGDHRIVAGAHDVPALTAALDTWVEGGALWLASRGVGHAFPTGDLFRALTVEVSHGDGWLEIARFGRTFTADVDAAGIGRKRLVADTALRPGAPARVPLGEAARWRVVYHWGSPRDEARARISPLTVVLAEGTAPTEDPRRAPHAGEPSEPASGRTGGDRGLRPPSPRRGQGHSSP